jgi:hypothetical protein
MANNELQQKWPTIKSKLLEKHPELTEEDLRYELGKDSELLLRLTTKLKKTDKEIHDLLSILG